MVVVGGGVIRHATRMYGRHGGERIVGVTLHVSVQLHVRPLGRLTRYDTLNREGMLSIEVVVRIGLQLSREEHTLVENGGVGETTTAGGATVQAVHVLKVRLMVVVVVGRGHLLLLLLLLMTV